MKDCFGREINYLRISLTQKCNLSCCYCRPGVPCAEAYQCKAVSAEKPAAYEEAAVQNRESLPEEQPKAVKAAVQNRESLSAEQIVEICRAAASLGIDRIKLTGGEPLLRQDLAELIETIKAIEGIRSVTLTTNGVLLSHLLPRLFRAGIDAINISLDSTDARLYRQIAGADCLAQVLQAIRDCLAAGVLVKLNCVAADFGEAGTEPSWKGVLKIAKELPVAVRLIEMMPLGLGKGFTAVPVQELKREISRQYGTLTPDPTCRGNGPAEYYRLDGFAGCVGFIASVHGKFCSSCSRIRLTSDGWLKSCLCYAPDTSLDEVWTIPDVKGRQERICQLLAESINKKPQAHCFEHPAQITEGMTMEKIGG